MSPNFPVVLTIGGHDPSGGAGITADVETISSLSCLEYCNLPDAPTATKI